MIEHNLKLISAPAIEPVTVAEVKLHAHIDHAVEDSLIETWIKSGRELAESFQRRAYYTQTWELIFDKFPPLPLNIPRAPLIEVLSVKYYDYEDTETVYDLDDLLIDTDSEPGRIAHVYGITWPTTTLRDINAVKIRFTAGYGDAGTTTTTSPDFVVEAIPANVKDAIMLYCSWRNENRTGETGEVPSAFFNLLRHDRVYI